MTTQSENNKRLIKNTLLLYGRMLLTVGISFYSTRLILANLGVDNYGIYNVIGGFVAMFYMITNTMTQAIGRFLTFDLGTGNDKQLQQTFSTSVNLLLIFSLFILIIAETLGLWFVNNKLNIAPDRMIAANWIYQFSVLTFIIEMISVPYSASIISHEKMGTFALVTIIKVLLTLGIALLLSVSPMDKLIFYGILVFIVSIFIQISYWIYCRKNFSECKYSIYIDKTILNHMFGYAGWQFFTSCASLLSTQGINIIMNMYLGTAINAAKGVSNQIYGSISSFSKNFTTALNPQITKFYAANELSQTKELVCNGSKYSFLLLFLPSLPCAIEIDFILSVWLETVPQYTGYFVIISLLNSLIEVLLVPFNILNNATGKIRNYQILISITQIIMMLMSYIVLRITLNPILTMLVSSILYIIIFIPRILLNKAFVDISIKYYAFKVLKGLFFVSTISLFIAILPHYFLESGWLRLIIVCVTSILSIIITTYIFALTNTEKVKVRSFIKTKIAFIRNIF